VAAAERLGMCKNLALDVTTGHDELAFVQIEDDGSVVFGVTMVTDKCPGNFVVVVHWGSNEAAEKFVRDNEGLVKKIAEEAEITPI
jgi:hypothetical protein